MIKKFAAGVAVAALATSGMVLANTTAFAATSGETITGTVFLDYAGDGAFTTTGPVQDSLLGGVTVTAYNAAGDAVGNATSTVNAASGATNYVLNVDAAAGDPLRVEFTNLPNSMHDSFNAAASDVQFITISDSENVVDYGVFDANQYSPLTVGDAANPVIATAIMAAGKRDHATVKDEPVLVGTKWNITANVTGRDDRTHGSDTQAVEYGHGSGKSPWSQRVTWATYGEIGSIFSVATDNDTSSVYAAASYKRFSDLGPQGIGGIYVMEGAVDADGAPQERTGLKQFDLESLGLEFGSNQINLADRGLGAPNKLLTDADAFKNAGKVGIGGIAIDSDARILYVVNLFKESIHAIDISNPASMSLIATIATPAAGPANENKRGFALSLFQGDLYYGYNDTGAKPFDSAKNQGMKYFVERVPALEAKATTFGDWETVIDGGDLGYTKGNPASGWGNLSGDEFGENNPQITRWNSWTDQWKSEPNSVSMPSEWSSVHSYPQPLISDFTFDREGFMTIGFIDRTQIQSGNINCAADSCEGNDPTLYETLVSGEILIAAPIYTVDKTKIASWKIENDGKASGDSGERNATAGRHQSLAAGEGPGGKEFFEDRQWYSGTPITSDNGNHREIGLGAVTVVPGTISEVVTTAYDPLQPIRAAGVLWFDLQTGDRTRGYQHTWDPGTPSLNGNRTSFQKGGGMGGLALLAKEAPVEIGNRTWLDLNGNGIQDAGEPSIAGATVELYKAGTDGKPTGTALETKTTDANGNYFFRSENASSGGTAGFTSDGKYVVVFKSGEAAALVELDWNGTDQPPGFPTNLKWQDLDGFTANTVNNGEESTRDSNADADGNALVTVGHAGANDHTVDAGWKLGTVTVGDRVWIDANRNGIQDAEDTENGVEGVLLKIYKGDDEITHDAFGVEFGEVRTDSDGNYIFEKLPVLADGETYQVRIVQADPDTITALDGYLPTLEEEGTDRAKDSSTWVADTEGLNTPGNEDLTLDFGFVVELKPSGTINKSDAAGNDANSADEAVDLGPTAGSTEIVFTIDNTGNEPLTNIGLVDVTTEGDGELVYPITFTTSKDQTFTLATAASRWTGELAVGEIATGTATLTGVAAGEDHTNVVTLWAKGVLTGKPVEDPENPSDDPEKPNRPEDPYNAKHLTYAIGDYVWIDSDKNGQQDPKEDPIAGVVVNLLNGAGVPVLDSDGDAVTTVTDADGLYMFDNLPAGKYIVEFVKPSGYKFTEQNAAGVPVGSNSDADVTTGRTAVITLGNDSVTKSYDAQAVEASEGIDPTWDAGVIPESVSVGDFVWQDLNKDGLQTPGEPGIDGVTLTLTGPNGPVTDVYGNPVQPTVTSDGGKYEFIDLPVLTGDERYTVTISNVPVKFMPTVPGENNGTGEFDSSTDTSISGPLTVDGAHDPTLDFGFVLITTGATINKSDENGNDANDPQLPADLTGSMGSTEIVFTITNSGTEAITNIGLVDVSTGSGTIAYPIYMVTSTGEEFELVDADDRWEGELAVGETATGRAMLTGVVAGKPHNNVVTLWADGAVTGDPVQDPENPSENPEEPNRPEDPYNAVVKTYAIGDYVWIDQIDPNGVQDSSEPGLGGVTVTLLNASGGVVATTSTTDDGYYLFDNLTPGEYQVQFDLPFGYVFIAPDAGDDDAIDSDAHATEGSNGTSGRTIKVTLDDTNEMLEPREYVQATEGIDPTWDAGVRKAKVTVGDKVWKDNDRDGKQTPGEPGIPGVVITIERSDKPGEPVTDINGNPVDPATTDEEGNYLFPNLPLLPEGVDYVVKIDPEGSKDALKDLVPTTPGVGEDPSVDSSTWEESSSGLEKDGDEDRTLDFGFVQPSVTVGDRVWEDSNKNGKQDPGEPGIEGVVLEIVDPNGEPVTDVYGNPVDPVTTDKNGNYLFPNLPALPEGESYTVKIDRDKSKEALVGFEPTKETEGDREIDSSTWESSTEGLTENGDKDLTLDFGFIRPSVSVGDKVWLDKNGNGRQDDGEPGIEGVVLNIFGHDGKPVNDVFGNPVTSVKTDKQGNYLFTDLPVLEKGQSYSVKIDRKASEEALKGLTTTKHGVGDREGDSSTWEAFTEGLTLDGESDITLDFGFVVVETPISNTGGTLPWLLLGFGGGSLILGAGIYLAGARKRETV